MRSHRKFLRSSVIVFAALAACFLVSCKPGALPESKRFHMSGEVLATDVPGNTVYVKHGDIPGFMGAMSMGYVAAKSENVASLHPGDKIEADIVVEQGQGRLEKIVVTEKASVPKN